MKEKVERLRSFTRFLTTFGKVERMLYIPGTDRRENDIEHSYTLALSAWYIISTEHLSLNAEKVIGYALVHDLVETFAGDTFIYSKDEQEINSKHDRESAALERIQKEYPEFSELHSMITEYERRDNAESRFVYALDKILPLILIAEDNGRLWKEENVTIDMIVTNKTQKVSISPEIKDYFDELVEMLKSRESELFA